MTDRYVRQELFKGIGKEGQKKLIESHVIIVGMGALGTASANFLARAGTGFLRIIDGDRVELCNLQRQFLYDEKTAKSLELKVDAAYKNLNEINSEIEIEAVAVNLKEENADKLLEGADLIIDATDNFFARYIINEFCVRKKVPWIYGGAVESRGMTMNMMPGGACLACMTGTDNPSSIVTDTCSEVGVLNTLPSIVAALQCTEAIKILTGAATLRSKMLAFDIWNNTIKSFDIERDENCPVCKKIKNEV